MDIRAIENMSAAELKAARAELVENTSWNPREVPERYVSALIDAKVRDEKLAEQGETITLLQEAAKAAKAALSQATAELKALRGQCAGAQDEAEDLRKQLIAEQARVKRLEKSARVHAAAIAEIARVANVSIANSQVDAASEG